MRFYTIAAISCLTTLNHVSATPSTMERLFAWLLEEQDLNVVGGLFPTDRAFVGHMGPGGTVDQLDEYGCWCYLDGGQGSGKGTPQDSIDTLCKVLADGYTCIAMDADEEGTPCVPWEENYQDIIGQTGGTYLDLCTANNPGNNCAIRSCVIETTFVRDVVTGYLFGNMINPALKHENGFDTGICAPDEVIEVTTEAALVELFEEEVVVVESSEEEEEEEEEEEAPAAPVEPAQPAPVTEAPVIAEPVPEVMCCGEYPTRHPFHTLEGSRSCCGAVTFDTLILDCCDADSSRTQVTC